MIAERAERTDEIEAARREERMDPLEPAAAQTTRVARGNQWHTCNQRMTTLCQVTRMNLIGENYMSRLNQIC